MIADQDVELPRRRPASQLDRFQRLLNELGVVHEPRPSNPAGGTDVRVGGGDGCVGHFAVFHFDANGHFSGYGLWGGRGNVS